jgi:hypothetical protein
MSQFLRRLRPTPSMAVAFTALLVALGGTSYAAATLAAGSVDTRQLRTHAVTGPKLDPDAVSRTKVRRAAVSPSKLSWTVRKALREGRAKTPGPAGPAGPAGPQGAAGANGTAIAFGTFGADGMPLANRSANLAGLRLNRAATGVYCYSGIDATVRNVVATLDSGAAAPGSGIAASADGFRTCPAGTQVEVTTWAPAEDGTIEAADRGFALAIN